MALCEAVLAGLRWDARSNRCGLTGFHGLDIVASMTQSGFSQRRLVDKLGIKRGMRALSFGHPITMPIYSALFPMELT